MPEKIQRRNIHQASYREIQMLEKFTDKIKNKFKTQRNNFFQIHVAFLYEIETLIN